MSSWLVARWRFLVPVAVAVVVALVVTVALVVPTLTDRDDSAAGEFDCTRLEEASFDDAGPKARACGVEVEVVGERTPWETSWSLPDGNSRLDVSTMPSRTNVSGEWTDMDITIEGTPGEGTLNVAAPVYPIELNAGGTAGQGAPLGSIERDGKRFDVWFPTELPVPSIEGAHAFYELADGVRLIVSVSVDGTGFLPVVELADPAAAARFQAMVDAARPAGFPGESGDLVFSTEVSDGLRLVPALEGMVNVVDEDDVVHFVSAPPVMWDSAGGDEELPSTVTEVSRGDRIDGPLDGDALLPMRTAVAGYRIVITPDEGMLTDAGTVWPVYVDPAFSGHGAAEWVAVRTGGYTGTLYKWTTSGGEGTGYCTDVASCNTTFRQRLSWEFSGMDAVRNLGRANVISASFRANGIHSASCTATATDLLLTWSLSTTTKWDTIGDWSAFLSDRTEAHRSDCGTRGYRNWDATEGLRRFAENDWATVTMGLKPHDDSTMTSWKRFGHDATLSVTYNQPPYQPSALKTLNGNGTDRGCVTGANRPYINTATPMLSALVKDPDGDSVSPHFQVYTKSGTTETEVWNSTTLTAQASNTTASATVTAGKLVENRQYFWRATSRDSSYGWWSGWGASCEFLVDITRPGKPTVSPVRSSTVQAVYESGFERGGVDLGGKFLVTAAQADTDVVAFEYWFTRATPTAPKTTSTTDGTLTIPVVPRYAGADTLTVKSIDRAGNKSAAATYSFDVAAPVEDAVWKLDENAGQRAVNSGPLNAGDLVLKGDVSWVDGPHREFGSRDGDFALRFDGPGEAAVGDTVLNTKSSFTVSAHVRLDDTSPVAFTAVSQDGVTQSAFELGARSDCDGNGAPCWSFSMPNSATGAAATSATVLFKDLPPMQGQWVHLVGEHNATANNGTAQTVRLWVCPVGTPDAPASGAPVGSAAVTRPAGSAWQGPGGFTVGRGLADAVGARWWPGVVDNVRVFSGEVVDASKLRRLCQGAEAESYGTGADGFDLIDPTVLTVEEN